VAFYSWHDSVCLDKLKLSSVESYCIYFSFIRKSKAQKEKEEKQKEEELQAQLQKEAETQPTTDNKPFEMPCDSNLFKYLEEITEKIQPLPTTREQVVALAQ